MKSAAMFSFGVMGLLVLSAVAADKASDDDLKKLQGTWMVVTGSNNGDDFAAGGKFGVEGNKYKIQRKDGSEAGAGLLGSNGTVKLDASKSPPRKPRGSSTSSPSYPTSVTACSPKWPRTRG